MTYTLLDLAAAEAAVVIAVKSGDIVAAKVAVDNADTIRAELIESGIDVDAARRRSWHRSMAEDMTEALMHIEPEDLA